VHTPQADPRTATPKTTFNYFVGAVIVPRKIDFNGYKKLFVYNRMRGSRPPATSEMKLETEKEIEYESKIMEIRNIFKNQERVIEELMLKILNIKIENEEVGEVA
jgi:hypothetical protein